MNLNVNKKKNLQRLLDEFGNFNNNKNELDLIKVENHERSSMIRTEDEMVGWLIK